ncbi:MAG: hypothetical protein MRJ68_07795 [Nitrospira sp.]|nr:hypothetical protein [Nitrospira sp.]
MQIDAKATDEIGTLVESFNRMTQDLQGGKSKLEEANLTLGIRTWSWIVGEPISKQWSRRLRPVCCLSTDMELVTTFNPSAERILGLEADPSRERPANEVFKEFSLDLFQTAYDRMLTRRAETISILKDSWIFKGKLITIGLKGPE